MSRRVIIILIAVVIAAALATAAFLFLPKKQTNAESEAVISAMEQMIPGFGSENQVSSGFGRDPLAALSINGLDIVGGLEIPSLDLCAPITVKGVVRPCFVTWISGSPVSGSFCLSGSREDVFSRLTNCEPGDKVIFTDIDGVRYKYEVTTQFHLKNWDEAEYDLMLFYETDKDTKFVLGCMAE